MEEPGRRPFPGVDLRRPKGYPALAEAEAEATTEVQGDPCPRCQSRDTKFCYYNNYNTSQPRHYCRSCRRYWTKGGTLRNVPVGGGSRKSASSSSSSSSSSASPKGAKNSKRQRVALAAPPETQPGTTDAAGSAHTEPAASDTIVEPAIDVDAARATANSTVGDPATAVDAERTEAAIKGTGMDEPAASTEATANGATMDGPIAPQAANYVGFADHPSVALGFGLTDATGKEAAPDLGPFEWPPGCDLGSYWAPGVFADADPVLFLNLP